MVDISKDPRFANPQPLRPPSAARGLPGSPPGILRPPIAQQPPVPVALRPPVITTPTNPPPPAIHVGLRGQPPPPQLLVQPHTGERPVVGSPQALGPEKIVPRGLLPSAQLIQRPPKEAHLANVNFTEPAEQKEIRTTDSVCVTCTGTKMIDVLKTLDGVIYSFRRCPNC